MFKRRSNCCTNSPPPPPVAQTIAMDITGSMISWVVFKIKLQKFAFQKQPILLLNVEVNWQASASSLSKELHAMALSHPPLVAQTISFILPSVVQMLYSSPS